ARARPRRIGDARRPPARVGASHQAIDEAAGRGGSRGADGRGGAPVRRAAAICGGGGSDGRIHRKAQARLVRVLAALTQAAHENPSGVSTIELFFDLVFVFVITQMTQLVEHAHEAADFLKALLVLMPIWWMYAGYVWLTNNVRPDGRMRLVLIA